MGRYYILRIYFIFWLSRTLNCQKGRPKIRKIWHHFHALYSQQVSSHMRAVFFVSHICIWIVAPEIRFHTWRVPYPGCLWRYILNISYIIWLWKDKSETFDSLIELTHWKKLHVCVRELYTTYTQHNPTNIASNNF